MSGVFALAEGQLRTIVQAILLSETDQIAFLTGLIAVVSYPLFFVILMPWGATRLADRMTRQICLQSNSGMHFCFVAIFDRCEVTGLIDALYHTRLVMVRVIVRNRTDRNAYVGKPTPGTQKKEWHNLAIHATGMFLIAVVSVVCSHVTP